MTTKAEHIAAICGNDGDKTYVGIRDKVNVSHLCEGFADAIDVDRDKERFQFLDGSAIVVGDSGWYIEGDKPFSRRDDEKVEPEPQEDEVDDGDGTEPARVSVDLVNALAAMTSDHATNYQIQALHVDGRNIVATDGRKMAIVKLPERIGDGTFNISDEPIFAHTVDWTTLYTEEGELRATVTDEYGTSVACMSPAHGDYPDYMDVVPEGEDDRSFTFKTDHLRSLLDVLEGAGYTSATIHIAPGMPVGDTPARLEGHKDEHGAEPDIEVTGVLTTVRTREDTSW